MRYFLNIASALNICAVVLGLLAIPMGLGNVIGQFFLIPSEKLYERLLLYNYTVCFNWASVVEQQHWELIGLKINFKILRLRKDNKLRF